MAACCSGLPYVSDLPTAEVCALWDGLILVVHLGCNRLEVNSDSKEVTDVMRNGGNSLGAADVIYEECTLMCRNFVRVIFDHCSREANRAAHLLASNSESSMSSVWHEDPPDYLVSTLADDVKAASFRRTLSLTRVSKGTDQVLMRRLPYLIYGGKFQKQIMH